MPTCLKLNLLLGDLFVAKISGDTFVAHYRVTILKLNSLLGDLFVDELPTGWLFITEFSTG